MKYLVFAFLTLSHSVYAQRSIRDFNFSQVSINKSNESGKQGTWIFRNTDGSVSEVLSFINDTLNGHFLSFWPNGNLHSEGYYMNGKPDSYYIRLWKNGSLWMKGFYQNGLPEGIQIQYREDGKLESRRRYLHGREDSLWVDYYNNPNRIIDNIYRGRMDTTIERSGGDWNKKYKIYCNDSPWKTIMFFNNIPATMDEYGNLMITKRTIYFKKAPYTVEKLFYYSNKKLIKSEYYNLDGDLLKTIFN